MIVYLPTFSVGDRVTVTSVHGLGLRLSRLLIGRTGTITASRKCADGRTWLYTVEGLSLAEFVLGSPQFTAAHLIRARY